METVRNREMWLLSQVETIQHSKEEALNTQLSQLNQAIGLLKAVMKFAEDGSVDASAIEDRLNQCLDRYVWNSIRIAAVELERQYAYNYNVVSKETIQVHL